MLYTEKAAKANVRNRSGRRVFYLGSGDTLTPGARDWLKGEKIEILPAEQAKPDVYRLLSGGYLTQKPEHMTHLNGDLLVEKTHPRIVFRGAMDSLEAQILLTMHYVAKKRNLLQELLDLARQIVRCEVLGETLREGTICGMTADELRRRSHFPQDYYGQPHFMPEASDGEQIAQLNRLRTVVREAEIKAVAAFLTPEGQLSREDIPRALNRMSSAVYLAMIEVRSEGKP